MHLLGCINKTSSAELQEAINSMFEWYGRAKQCYAYLSDVSLSRDAPPWRGAPLSVVGQDMLCSSRWFTRGWTLQELIAPQDVEFYDRHWRSLGTRSFIKERIAERTGIKPGLLNTGYLFDLDISFGRNSHLGREDTQRWLGHFSIAQRMSWAAGRTCTRVEDRAYSLLGIFRMTMPLVYGEGHRAFVRLQEEILRVNPTPDLSLLLWERPELPEYALGGGFDFTNFSIDDTQCLFAPTPDAFAKCGSVQFYPTDQAIQDSVDMVISNMGMKARILVMPLQASIHENANFAAVLNCHDEGDITSTIALKLTSHKLALNDGILRYGDTRDRVLTASSYSLHDAANQRALERTIRIDSIDAQRNATSREVFLTRRSQVANMLIKRAEGRSVEPYVWLRFNVFRALEPKWSVLHTYPDQFWDTSHLKFRTDVDDDYGFQGFFINRSNELKRAALQVGAIAFQCFEPIDIRVVLCFSSDLFFRVDMLEAGQDVDTDLLCSYCMNLETEHEFNVVAQQRGDIPEGTWSETKVVQILEGNRLYDSLCFVVMPDQRNIFGKTVNIFQLGCSSSARQFEADLEEMQKPVNADGENSSEGYWKDALPSRFRNVAKGA